ncbi:MAG TPA: sigma-54 dependent transcriptional regulator [Thermoanaerobaculia bacterium]|nr:sigma-54 dependent transcriptional regulator [Thermoanaerobaculia bacterium]
MSRVLIVDDDPTIQRHLSGALREHGHEVRAVTRAEQALHLAEEWHPALALSELRLPDLPGLELLTRLLRLEPHPTVIMLTSHPSVSTAVEAMRRGAFDYLPKPLDEDRLATLLCRVLELQDARSEAESPGSFSEIIGVSPAIQEVFRILSKVAAVDVTVLATGESGTGKELVARAIHRKSRRSGGPFVAVNCSAIPESLVEAELFGHEKGAFTDAQISRLGIFEQADGGTLFLDEVCDLSPAAQAKLLRVLQERQIVRLGSRTPQRVDVRVIAATNKDPEAEVKAGNFRDDLYWRLNVVDVHLPSLRERREDLSILIEHFFRRFQRELGLPVASIESEARALLLAYDWPGNIRELENTLCRAMILCNGELLKVADLPERILGQGGAEANEIARSLGPTTLAEAVENVTARLERVLIIRRLAECHGNRTATAESLGISRKTLFNKMRQYGIESAGNGEVAN